VLASQGLDEDLHSPQVNWSFGQSVNEKASADMPQIDSSCWPDQIGKISNAFFQRLF
jgi:hypothetical protein